MVLLNQSGTTSGLSSDRDQRPGRRLWLDRLWTRDHRPSTQSVPLHLTYRAPALQREPSFSFGQPPTSPGQDLPLGFLLESW